MLQDPARNEGPAHGASSSREVEVAAASLLSELAKLDDAARLPRTPTTLEEVHAYLVDRISWLLDHRLALLMSILYRIDVHESRVKEIFLAAAPGEIPSRLAHAMIERQLQKLGVREQYREDPPSPWRP